MNEQESNAGTKIKALEDKHVELTEKLVKMKGEIKEKIRNSSRRRSSSKVFVRSQRGSTG
jgi:chaperonin cofactor prefoldin